VYYCICPRVPRSARDNDSSRPAMPRPSRYLSVPLLTAAVWMALPAMAQEWGEPEDGVKLERAASPVTQIVPAEVIEQQAAQEYEQIKQEAIAKRALGNDTNPQLLRLRAIGKRLLPETTRWNPRARDWNWEINLIGSKQINAFCMPGGKIAFYWGILSRLQLTDDEVAMVMGHEMTHALREHGRAQIGKQVATQGTIALLAGLFGWSNASRQVAGMGGRLLSLKYSRDDETEADLIGLELAARAGYDPRAALSLWRKMEAASQGAPPAFLSDHPSNPDRLRTIAANIPRVQGLYERAPKPDQRFGPPVAR